MGLARMRAALPAAGPSPAIEAGGDGGPSVIARGQVAPGRAGAVDLQQPIDEAAMVCRRSVTLAAPGWSLLRKQCL